MSATFPNDPDEPEDEGQDQEQDNFELDEEVSKEFNKGLDSFLRSLEDDETSDDAPVEPAPSVAPTHTAHKDEQTWQVTLDVIHQYVIEVTAPSPEEASKVAIENFPALQPEETRAHIASVENVMPMTIDRLEASWEIIKTSDLNFRMKHAKAIELMHDIKGMIERAEVDNMERADVDRLEFLQKEIVELLTG